MNTWAETYPRCTTCGKMLATCGCCMNPICPGSMQNGYYGYRGEKHYWNKLICSKCRKEYSLCKCKDKHERARKYKRFLK